MWLPVSGVRELLQEPCCLKTKVFCQVEIMSFAIKLLVACLSIDRELFTSRLYFAYWFTYFKYYSFIYLFIYLFMYLFAIFCSSRRFSFFFHGLVSQAEVSTFRPRNPSATHQRTHSAIHHLLTNALTHQRTHSTVWIVCSIQSVTIKIIYLFYIINS